MGLFSAFSDFFGSKDRSSARAYGDLATDNREQMREYQSNALGVADEQFDADQAYISSEQQRYDDLYAPVETAIANRLEMGAQTGSASAIAGGAAANSFDASTASRNQQMQAAGVNYRPGSSAGRAMGEDDVYNRAMGISSAQTGAFVDEENQNFQDRSDFYNTNGTAIKDSIQSGMATMYAADYNAQNLAASQQAEQSAYNQGVSNQYSNQSKAGLNLAAGLAGNAASAYINAATGGVSGAATSIASKAIDTQTTPNYNSYMTGNTPNQTQAAIAGNNAQYYTQNYS